MADELPELTDDERKVLDEMDMTSVLGTWKERHRVVMDAAIRYMRENKRLREENSSLHAQLSIDDGFPFGGHGR